MSFDMEDIYLGMVIGGLGMFVAILINRQIIMLHMQVLRKLGCKKVRRKRTVPQMRFHEAVKVLRKFIYGTVQG